mmetsp:Transcript_28417/g.50574  ORF Transcript_28417/g.50574 Transcript_28417/m.50574 type:complete len:81 (+) Transcript_28417:56-298(+)
MSARSAGFALSALSVIIFSYYTTWALVLPYLDLASPLHNFFLPRKWAFIIPSALLVAFIVFVVSFLVYASVKSSAQKKAK